MEISESTIDSRAQRNELMEFYNKMSREFEFCEQWIHEAEKNGDSVLCEFFKEIRAQDRLRSFRMKEFLLHRYSL